MKKFNLIAILLLCVMSFGLTSCDEEEDHISIVYDEYVMTVASKTLQGHIINDGALLQTEVLAVKTLAKPKWHAFPMTSIKGFQYEPGYEYELLIGENSCVDDRLQDDPLWSEYKLVKVISKEKIESEGLPEDFLTPEIPQN